MKKKRILFYVFIGFMLGFVFCVIYRRAVPHPDQLPANRSSKLIEEEHEIDKVIIRCNYLHPKRDKFVGLEGEAARIFLKKMLVRTEVVPFPCQEATLSDMIYVYAFDFNPLIRQSYHLNIQNISSLQYAYSEKKRDELLEFAIQKGKILVAKDINLFLLSENQYSPFLGDELTQNLKKYLPFSNMQTRFFLTTKLFKKSGENETVTDEKAN